MANRITCLILAALMLAIMLPVPFSTSSQVEAALPATSNDVIGEYTLFDQDFADYSDVPDNVFSAYPFSPWMDNGSLSFDSSPGSVRYNLSTEHQRGRLYISGLVPVVNCTYYLNFSQTWVTLATSKIDIFVSDYNYLEHRYLANGTHQLTAYYRDTPASYTYQRMYIESLGHSYINLEIGQNGYDKTWSVYYSGTKQLTSLPYSEYNARNLVYPAIGQSYIQFAPAIGTADSVRVDVYSLTQTMDEKYLTALGLNNQSFGVDGPPDSLFDSIADGMSYLEGKGFSATIWVDETSQGYTESDQVAYIKGLVNNGTFELGVHFSAQLATRSYADACTIMTNTFNNLTTKYGTSPRTWCSLQNNDNWSHANYAYLTHDMVWRNGQAASGGTPNMANLDNTTWYIWGNASHDYLNPTFTHNTDEDPTDDPYSIDYSRFTDFVDRYYDNDSAIIDFEQYWKVNANTGVFDLLNASLSSSGFGFDAYTNGYKALVYSQYNWVFPNLDAPQYLYTDGHGEYVFEGGERCDTHLRAVPTSGRLTVTDCEGVSGDTVFSWTADTPATYTFSGMGDFAYRVFIDDEIFTVGYGPTFSFSAVSGSFSIEVWYSAQVSHMVILTVNMVGVGIIVSIAYGFVLPLAHRMQRHQGLPTKQVMNDLIRLVIFIVVGVALYGMLYQMFIAGG